MGLKIGIPISILFLLTVVVAIITAALVLLTRHYKRKSYEVVCRRELARLSFSNAYISSTRLNTFAFLKSYNIEYNYASLEIVSELGEGAFGEVYKGIIKCPIVNPKVRSSAKTSICTPVAIKLLKCK